MTEILSWIVYPFAWFFSLLYGAFKNYGLAIIAFTLVTKLIMIPLSVSQQKSMLKQAKYSPKIKKLQETYKDDKAKLNEEMQNLYKEEGYNPLTGCLPLLLQMPIIFILFDVIRRPLKYLMSQPENIIKQFYEICGVTNRNEITLYNAVMGKINSGNTEIINYFTEHFPQFTKYFSDNTQVINFNFLWLDLTQNPTVAFNRYLWIPIFAALTGVALSMVTQRYSAMQQSGQNPKMMMFMGPMISLVFTFTFPSGIGLYWIIGNIFSIIQQYILGEMYNPKKVVQQLEDDASAKKDAERDKKKNKKNRYNYNDKSDMIKYKNDVIEGEFTESDDDSLSDN